MDTNKFTDRQIKFCDEYLVDLNATQAAIRAGYSIETAAQMGYENLKKPHIVKCIRKQQILRRLRTQVRQDRVLEALEEIAFAQDGVKISDKLKALDKLMKHLGMFDMQTDELLDLIVEKKVSEPHPDDVSEKCWRLTKLLRPMMQLSIREAIIKKRKEKIESIRDTNVETGCGVCNSEEYELNDNIVIGLIKERLPDNYFRELMKEAGLDPDNYLSEPDSQDQP